MNALTERRCTVDSIAGLEESIAQSHRLKDLTSLPHDILLLLDVLHPFALTHISTSPQCYLVVFAPQVDEGNRIAALYLLYGYDWRVRQIPS